VCFYSFDGKEDSLDVPTSFFQNQHAVQTNDVTKPNHSCIQIALLHRSVHFFNILNITSVKKRALIVYHIYTLGDRFL